MKHLKSYKIFESNLTNIVDKLKSKLKDMGNAISREAKETKVAGQILVKIISGEEPTEDEVKILKGQSIDLVKILSILGLQAIPGSSVAIVALEKAAKKYGFTLFPEDQKVDESFNNAGLNSMVLVAGRELEDKTRRLYAIPAASVIYADRMRADGTKGKAASMVILGDTYYRLSMEGGQLKAKKADLGDRVKTLHALGMTEKNLSGQRIKIALNSKTGKTPLHFLTLRYIDIHKMLRELQNEILNISNIKW